MGFDEFLGNERIVRALRGMLQRERVPSALLFTGPRGIGKYTLARMFAQAANCQRLRDDFCGECDSCLRMAPLADPSSADRGGPRRARRKRGRRRRRAHAADSRNASGRLADRSRSGAPAHSGGAAHDPRRAVARGAARGLFQAARPAPRLHPRRRGYDALDRRRPFPQNSRGAARIRDADSACAHARFAAADDPLALPAISFRAGTGGADRSVPERTRRTRKPAERKLAAQLSEGSPGAALSLDLEESARLRRSVLHLLDRAVCGREVSPTSLPPPLSLPSRRRNRLKTFWACSIVCLQTCSRIPLRPKSSLPRNPDLHREVESSWQEDRLGVGSAGYARPRHARKPLAPQYRPPTGSGRADCLT